jgi:sporulation protein YlmC with PRC-barrel domain
MLFKTKKREHYKLNRLDGRTKKAADFYFDDQQWTIRYLVADTGLELTDRKVLISPSALGEAFKKEHLICVNLAKKQIEDSPLIDCDELISHQCEVDYSQYYGSPHYWGGTGCWGSYPTMLGGPILTNIDHQKYEEDGNTHLRSINEVSTYHIHASDGKIGQVEDFIIDDKTWTIRYLVVNTRNGSSGKRVLISPVKIERVSWVDSEVFVNLTREEIVSAPEYTKEASLNRDYEPSLFKHY